MDLDYYAILGVPPEADIQALRQAYRIRAFECHPDCGGSHGQMVLVNEAWAILSNPMTRRHYDFACRNRSDYVAQRSVREDAQAARQKAQEYPRKWPDFEVWLDRLFRDFTEVNYGTTEGAGITWPTAGRSVSGWLLIIAGGLAGGIFGVCVGSYIIFSLGLGIDDGADKPGAFLSLLSTAGGAWLGALLHKRIGKFLDKKG
ncbi:MAG: J domain-containing protein [Thermodesulfobacteriota bacterium]|nr:J domain-containing protein [Thermodesulfobacteriota bacterium]